MGKFVFGGLAALLFCFDAHAQNGAPVDMSCTAWNREQTRQYWDEAQTARVWVFLSQIGYDKKIKLLANGNDIQYAYSQTAVNTTVSLITGSCLLDYPGLTIQNAYKLVDQGRLTLQRALDYDVIEGAKSAAGN